MRPWPSGPGWDEYWDAWEEALLTRSLLLVDKTRRTMASNVLCAFDLWLASGGVDPRWPVLSVSTSRRSVLIQARKQEGEVGSQEFLARIAEMCRISVDRGLRERWPSFPEWTWSIQRGRSSTGSLIEALPQGADQVRGPGTLLIHMEELATWEQAEESVGAAIPSLYPDGHLVAITTPRVNSYARDIRDGKAGARGGQQALAPAGYDGDEMVERG